MSVPLAYVGVVLIWSTTPLAIKWSGQGPGFLFGVASRMVIGLALCLLLLAILRKELPWHAKARRTYLAAGMGFFGAMMCVYWGAQFIPSGLVSVLFGLTPVVTGLMAAAWLGEPFTPLRLLGVLLGLSGLVVIFGASSIPMDEAAWGVAAIVAAVHLHSASTVWVKRIDAGLPPLAASTGALMIAVPLYLLTWLGLDGEWPDQIPVQALGAIAYLGVVGSVAGSVLFFYVLKHVEASKLGLIPLLTPTLALLVGATVAGERVAPSTLVGAGLILSGLVFYLFADLMFAVRPARRRRRAPAPRVEKERAG